MSEIDWDAEIRKIEREYDGLPPEQPAGLARSRKAAEWRERQRIAEGRAILGAWVRIALVVVLATALYWWPNAHQCGRDLGEFMAATMMVVIGGLWVSAFTWRHRLATIHGAAIALLVSGLTLVAAQTLPRAGLATIGGIHASQWRCTIR